MSWLHLEVNYYFELTVYTISTVHFMEGFPHFICYDNTQPYVNTFGTKQSVCIIIDGCISGVFIRRGPLSHKALRYLIIYNHNPTYFLGAFLCNFGVSLY